MPSKDPQKQKEYNKQYYITHQKEILEQKKQYHVRNRKEILKRIKEYQQRPEIKKHIREYWEKSENRMRRNELRKRPERRIKRKGYRYRDYVREKELVYRHEYYRRPEIKQHRREYVIEYNQRPEVRKRMQEWYVKYDRSPERLKKRREYDQIRRHRPDRKLAIQLRVKIWTALHGKRKCAPTMELIGCTIGFLWNHLEEQFKPGMTHENYGPVWHVDHIIPCAWWNLFDPDHQRTCFHWTNLQPLFGAENCSKGARRIEICKNVA